MTSPASATPLDEVLPEGEVEKTTLEYIIRDHDMDLFQARKKQFAQLVADLNNRLGVSNITSLKTTN